MTEPDLDRQLARIAGGIAEVQRQISWIDANVFGRNRNLRRWRPEPVSACELDALETQLDVRLPAGYRAYLTSFGTGPVYQLLDPDEIVVTNRPDHGGADPWAHVRRPFSLIDGVGAGMYQTGDESDHLLDGALIIYVGGCTFCTILAVTGDSAGTVWTNDWAKPGRPNEYVWAPAQTVYPSAIGSERVTFLQWIQAGLAARLAATAARSNASQRSSAP